MIVLGVPGVSPVSMRSSVAFLWSGIVAAVAGVCILIPAVGKTAVTRSTLVLWVASCFTVWSMGRDVGHPFLVASIGIVSVSLGLWLSLWFVFRHKDHKNVRVRGDLPNHGSGAEVGGRLTQ